MRTTHDIKRLNTKQEFVIALDDLSFEWTRDEIKTAITMYNDGCSIRDMALKVRPYTTESNSLDEVAILIMHLARQNKIKPRG